MFTVKISTIKHRLFFGSLKSSRIKFPSAVLRMAGYVIFICSVLYVHQHYYCTILLKQRKLVHFYKKTFVVNYNRTIRFDVLYSLLGK